MSLPRSTVRLQLHGGFTLYDAREQVDYFSRLGISHFYLSPITQARPGSTHGYDVVDHAVVSAELGGEKGLTALAKALRKQGMGLILDIVPNHMATHQDNRWWWDVLKHGQRSQYAGYFDIDWHAPGLRGKVLAPFLPHPYAESLADGSVRVAVDEGSGAPVIEACGARYPVAPGTLHAMGMDGRQAALYYDGGNPEGRQRLHDLLERQHYRLAWWRCAADSINWRRFFEISDLIGVRVEEPSVFAAVHDMPLRLYAEGLVDGLRIDHVDGLADPGAYCRRLRAALQARAQERPATLGDEPAWLVVEKILAPDESLDGDWQVDGTSGYDFMEQAGALLHDPRGQDALTQEWVRIAGDARPIASYTRDARALLLRRHFVAERKALLCRLAAIAASSIEARDWTSEAIARMLDEILLEFPHYRSYAGPDGRSAADAHLFNHLLATVQARLHAYDRQTAGPLLDWLGVMLGGKPLHPEVIRRFQQLTPPLAAKSLEDTVFYRYGRLLSRNEVGADPGRIALDIQNFHQGCARRAIAAPRSMLATATHDHKRGEDARARLAVLSEIPEAWRHAVQRWETMLRSAPDAPAHAAAERYMLFQTMVAAWPLDLEPDDQKGMLAFGERLKQWQIKALREAKLSSNWVEPDRVHERLAEGLIDGMMPGARHHAVVTDLAAFVRRVSAAGAINSLVQTVLRMSVPGVPDLYQGTEFWDFSLVDPDNRRPVDFKARRRALGQDARIEELLKDWKSGRIKQAVLAAAYALRAAMPDVFAQGDYQPLMIHGRKNAHVVAYARHAGDAGVFVLAPLRCAAGVMIDETGGQPRLDPGFWQDTQVALSGHYANATLCNALTGARHRTDRDGRLNLADVLPGLPVAMLHAV